MILTTDEVVLEQLGSNLGRELDPRFCLLFVTLCLESLGACVLYQMVDKL